MSFEEQPSEIRRQNTWKRMILPDFRSRHLTFRSRWQVEVITNEADLFHLFSIVATISHFTTTTAQDVDRQIVNAITAAFIILILVPFSVVPCAKLFFLPASHCRSSILIL